MNEARARTLYAALVAAAFAAVALWRLDLVLEAGRMTALSFSRGGVARWRLLGEIGLFSAILVATWKTIAVAPRPAHDAAVILIATAAGWAAEAWGTRLGLWGYYTDERPPLWIVPAWPLGAALLERLSAQALRRFGPAPPQAYWMAAAAATGVSLWFCGPHLTRPLVWAGPLAVALALFLEADPPREFWTLTAGFICVLFADFWGTTNGCWSYYLRGQSWGLWRGIAFGMTFDAAVVLGCLRLAARLEPGFYHFFSCFIRRQGAN